MQLDDGMTGQGTVTLNKTVPILMSKHLCGDCNVFFANIAM